MTRALFAAPGPKLSLRLFADQAPVLATPSVVLVYRGADGETGFDSEPQGLALLAGIVAESRICDWRRGELHALAGSAGDMARMIRLHLKPVAVVVRSPDDQAVNELDRIRQQRRQSVMDGLRQRYGRPAAQGGQPSVAADSLPQRLSPSDAQYLLSHSDSLQIWGMSDRGMHVEILGHSSLDPRALAAGESVDFVQVDHQDALPSW